MAPASTACRNCGCATRRPARSIFARWPRWPMCSSRAYGCAARAGCRPAPCRSPCTFMPAARNCSTPARATCWARRRGRNFATVFLTRPRNCGTRPAPCWPPATRSSTTRNEAARSTCPRSPRSTMTEANQDILVHTAAGVSSITFQRVAKKNALTSAMYAALADALAAAQADAGVRVLVFQGDAGIFSAGNDIADFLQQPPPTQDSPVLRFLHGLAAFATPVVASVCGPAVGIGTTMLLHCDLVYAGDNALFSMPFVNLGLCPEAASSLLLPQLLGYQRAAEALLLGLVTPGAPPAECNGLAQAQAGKLARKPLSALIETKRLMKCGQSAQVRAAMAQEGASFGRMLRQPPAPEALEEGRRERAGAAALGERGRRLWPHAARAGGAGGVCGVHAKAPARFQRSLIPFPHRSWARWRQSARMMQEWNDGAANRFRAISSSATGHGGRAQPAQAIDSPGASGHFYQALAC